MSYALFQNKSWFNNLPDHWKLKTFNEIVRDVTGGNEKVKKEEYLEKGLHPVVDQGKKLIAGYTNKESLVNVEGPCIVFGDHTRIFKYVDFKFVLGADGVKVFIPKVENILEKYLYYYFLTLAIPDTGYNRHFKFLKEVIIPIPSLEEQKKIVAVLDKAQALIEKRKETIAKLDELIQAVFIDMFGDPIKNPRSYEVVQLNELISFLTSGSRGWAKYFSKEGEMFITIKNVKNGQLQLRDITYVNAPIGKESERTKVKEGDLLISITADLGRTAVINKDVASRGAYINQHLSLIRLNQKCNPRYISSYLESVGGKRQFESLNQTGVKSGLNFAAIKSLKIVLPPLEKQDRYDAFYRKYLLEKENMITSLAMLEENFNALLQRLVTGDIEINTEVTA